MKTAIYIEDGRTQIVLTPETDWERNACAGLKDGVQLDVKQGSFYHCQGGWIRQGSDDRSIMLTIIKEAQTQQERTDGTL